MTNLCLHLTQNRQRLLWRFSEQLRWRLQRRINPHFRHSIALFFFQNLCNLSLKQTLCWLCTLILFKRLIWHLGEQRRFTLLYTFAWRHIKYFRRTFNRLYLIHNVLQLIDFLKILSVESGKFRLHPINLLLRILTFLLKLTTQLLILIILHRIVIPSLSELLNLLIECLQRSMRFVFGLPVLIDQF